MRRLMVLVSLWNLMLGGSLMGVTATPPSPTTASPTVAAAPIDVELDGVTGLEPPAWTSYKVWVGRSRWERRAEVETDEDGIGTAVVAVISGRYAVTVYPRTDADSASFSEDTVVRHWRAGANQPEQVPLGTEIVVTTGDVVAFPLHARLERNTGEEPLELLMVFLTGLGPTSSPRFDRPGSDVEGRFATAAALVTWEQIALRVQLVTLGPREGIAGNGNLTTVQVVAPADVWERGVTPDMIGPKPGYVWLEPDPEGGACNTGEEQLEVYVLTLAEMGTDMEPGGTSSASTSLVPC